MTLRTSLLALVSLILVAGFLALPTSYANAGKRAAAPAVETVRLPVLRRRIDRYETIAANDIAWTETSIRRVPRNAITDVDELIGKAARRRLNAGRPILARDIQTPLAIRKGDLVAIVYTTPYMTLTARGRALQDAPAGGAVRILNAHSRRTVEATAIAPGIVATRPFSHAQLAEAMQ